MYAADVLVDEGDESFDLLVISFSILEAVVAAPRENDVPAVWLRRNLVVLESANDIRDERCRPIVRVVLDTESLIGDKRILRLVNWVVRVHIHEEILRVAACPTDQAGTNTVFLIRSPHKIDLVTIIHTVLAGPLEVVVLISEEISLIAELRIQPSHCGGACRALHIPGDGRSVVEFTLQELATLHQVVQLVLVGGSGLFGLGPATVDNL